jgi:hypothetical protein
MNNVTKEQIVSYIEAAINLEAQSVAEVAQVAARAALEIATLDQINIGDNVDTFVLIDALSQQRTTLVSQYLIQVLQDYSQEFTGVDASIALQEISERNQV